MESSRKYVFESFYATPEYSESRFRNTAQVGTFWFPATRKYDSADLKTGSNMTVTCDRCQRGRIPCCVSTEDTDLCMTCVTQALLSLESEKRPKTPAIMSRMEARPYKRRDQGSSTLISGMESRRIFEK